MPRFIGPFEVIRVKGGGLSYDLKPFDSARTFTRAASDLKPYNARDPSKYPSHLAPPDSSDSETSREDDQSTFGDLFRPPSGSPDDPGQIGQNAKNLKIGPRSTRSHFAPGSDTDTPDDAIDRNLIELSSAKRSGSGIATGKNGDRLYTKPITFFRPKIFSKKPSHPVPRDVSRDTPGTSGRTLPEVPLPAFWRSTALPSGHGEPLMAEIF